MYVFVCIFVPLIHYSDLDINHLVFTYNSDVHVNHIIFTHSPDLHRHHLIFTHESDLHINQNIFTHNSDFHIIHLVFTHNFVICVYIFVCCLGACEMSEFCKESSRGPDHLPEQYDDTRYL